MVRCGFSIMSMPTVQSRLLPPESLLACHAQTGDYTDCFTCDVARAVSLEQLIEAFYNSAAFRPERWALHLIGKGAGGADVDALAKGTTTHFAAWSVVARSADEIVLQDFQHRTSSWLMVAPLVREAPGIPPSTRLHFGSRVRRPDSLTVRVLMPVHRFYARALLKSAAKRLR